MSDITKLTEKILKEAEVKSAAIIEKAKKDADLYAQQQEKKNKEKSQKRIDDYEKEALHKMELSISRTHIKAKKRILAAKQAKLDEVFHSSKEQLRKLDHERFMRFTEKALLNIPFEGEVYLQLGEYTKEQLSDEDKESLKQKARHKVNVLFSEDYLPSVSGFILSQKGIELNYTFEALLKDSQEELSAEVLAVLLEGSTLS